MSVIRERDYNGLPGLPMLLLFAAADAALIWMLVMNIRSESAPEIILAALLIALSTLMAAGLFMVHPNEGKVLQLFGAYKGTAKLQGLRWANPFFAKKKVSLRVRNFNSEKLKVNDSPAIRSRLQRSSCGGSSRPPKPNSRSTTTNTSSRCRPKRRCAICASYAYDAHDPEQISLRGTPRR